MSFVISAAVPDTPTDDTQIKDLATDINTKNLVDSNVNTKALIRDITINTQSDIDSLYIIFWDKPVNFTITAGSEDIEHKTEFLHCFVQLPALVTDCNTLTVKFEENANVSDIYAFTEGELPEWVQNWKKPYDRADLLLNATHPGDEHVTFAGLIPYYAIERKYRVQVVSFVDHDTQANKGAQKQRELLNGLWEAGITHYPVLSDMPYRYSTNDTNAINALKIYDYTQDDVYAFQTEMIRRFKPLVIVGHDLKASGSPVGYNGQTMLNAKTLTEAVVFANDPEKYPESAEKYGVWDTPKVYLHLYNENQITMNWDESLDSFGGRSAFQVTQEAYKQHTPFIKALSNRLYGVNNKITLSTEITTNSPSLYGLYRSTVGEDVNKNDFFENLTNYDEQERLAKEEEDRLYLEELKKQEESSKAEESKRLEESLRLESEAEESRRIAEEESESAKKESARLAAKEAAENNDSKSGGIIALIALIASIAALAVVLFRKFK